MARVYVSSVIDAPAARVWERIRDFNALPRWHPRIRDSRMQEMVDEVRDEGARAVIVLSHNGMDVDIKMASRVRGCCMLVYSCWALATADDSDSSTTSRP